MMVTCITNEFKEKIIFSLICLVLQFCEAMEHDGGSGPRLNDGSGVKLLLVGWYLMLVCSWTHRGST